MFLRIRIVSAVVAITLSSLLAFSQRTEIVRSKDYQPLSLILSAELQAILDEAIATVTDTRREKPFKPDEIAATIIDLGDPGNLKWASVRGEERIYPASVVKMFYMAALYQQLQDGKVVFTKELERGLRDMIVDSSNEATQYILDVLTETSSGAELPQKQFDRWQYKRNRVNRYFSSMGYTNINVNQKTFCEDAYGIERQSRNFPTDAANRNKLTTNATARLMSEIVLGRVVNADRSRTMMDLMKRDPFKESKDPDNQATGFTGRVLIDRNMRDAKLWSKAGWTSTTRHDVAYIEIPGRSRFVLAVFTENHSNERDPIPMVAGQIIEGLSK